MIRCGAYCIRTHTCTHAHTQASELLACEAALAALLTLLPMVLAAAEVYVGHELPLEVFVFHVSGCWLLFVTCLLLLRYMWDMSCRWRCLCSM